MNLYPVQSVNNASDKEGRPLKLSYTGAACPPGWTIVEKNGMLFYAKEAK